MNKYILIFLLGFTTVSCSSFREKQPKLTCEDSLSSFRNILEQNVKNKADGYIPLNDVILSSVSRDCWVGVKKGKLFELIPFQNIEIKHFKDQYQILIFPAESYKYHNVFIVNSLTFIIRDEKVQDAYFVYRN